MVSELRVKVYPNNICCLFGLLCYPLSKNLLFGPIMSPTIMPLLEPLMCSFMLKIYMSRREESVLEISHQL